MTAREVASAELRRISQTSDGVPANGSSSIVDITPDGRHVLIRSLATNLAPGLLPHPHPALYVYDVVTGVLELVSVHGNGTPSLDDQISGGSISADGRYVVFSATDKANAPVFVTGDTNRLADLFLRDRLQKTTTLLTKPSKGGQANGASGLALLTRDGSALILTSFASNLAPGTVVGKPAVLNLDLASHRFERIQLAAGSAVPNASAELLSISGDGRYVAFSSSASNMVQGDANGVADFFVRDRARGITELMLYRPHWNLSGGRQRLGGRLSGSGRYFGFGINFPLSATDRCSVGGTYLYDRSKGTASCVSINDADEGANAGGSSAAQITTDGRFVVFGSSATNLVAGDTNGSADMFVRDRQVPRSTQRIDLTASGAQIDTGGNGGMISDDGSVVAFSSYSQSVIPGSQLGPAGQTQVYLMLR